MIRPFSIDPVPNLDDMVVVDMASALWCESAD
jgi:hypothetical protein